jgi:hypothetical protein
MTNDIKKKAEALIKVIETGSFGAGKFVEINGISMREASNVVRQFKDELINCAELEDLKAALRPSKEEIADCLAEINLDHAYTPTGRTKIYKYIELAIEELRK